MKKIYLAIPFSGIEELSFKCANEVASLLINEGHYVFSPISHSYPIWKTEMVPHTYKVWLNLDKVFVDWCDEVWIINIQYENLNGFELIGNSQGVQQEMKWARNQNKPVKTISYNVFSKLLTKHG